MAVLEIRVKPNSKMNKVGGVVGNPPRLVVSVQEPAVDGKANSAVIRELARAFNLRPRDFSIVFGELGRDKRVKVNGDEIKIALKYEELLGPLKLF